MPDHGSAMRLTPNQSPMKKQTTAMMQPSAIEEGEIISVSGLYLDLEWGYVFAFVFFIVMMFVRPAGLMARRG